VAGRQTQPSKELNVRPVNPDQIHLHEYDWGQC